MSDKRFIAMSKNTPTTTQKTADAQQKKQERLAEALRANLKRRKTQTRSRKTIMEMPEKTSEN